MNFLAWFVRIEFCLVAMETCAAAHYGSRRLRELGHDARLIAPQFVAFYRKGGKSVKNDAQDAEAICEAASDAEAICEAASRQACSLSRPRRRCNKVSRFCTVRGRVLSKSERRLRIIWVQRSPCAWATSISGLGRTDKRARYNPAGVRRLAREDLPFEQYSATTTRLMGQVICGSFAPLISTPSVAFTDVRSHW
jgi:hypothetical protein